MSEKEKSGVQSAIDAVQRLAEIDEISLGEGVLGAGDEGSTDLVVLPAGKAIHDLKEYRDKRRTAPERRKGVAILTTLAGFIDHAKRFADDDSVIFADDSPNAPKLVAVLDYHRRTAAGAPRFGEHRGVYNFPLSDAWKRWAAVSKPGTWLEQAAFSELIDERFEDIREAPTEGLMFDAAQRADVKFGGPATMLMLTRGIKINASVNVANVITLSTGEGQIQYEERHDSVSAGKDHKPLKIPEAFVIGIPVFRGADAWALQVRLRYRRDGARVLWAVQIANMADALTEAFNEAAKDAAEKTGLPVLFGSPE